MNQDAKTQAISDIKDFLTANHRCFLAFNRSLNPIMNSLVEDQIKEQIAITHKKA